MKIKSALIQFNDHGTPTAPEFDDVYFSNEDGAAETDYVFIQGNRLRERFAECNQRHFVIAETGFGTGLNCAKAIEVFESFRLSNPDHVLQRLHIISVEKHPLRRQDLTDALAKQPSSDDFKRALVEQYPLALEGAHRLTFNAVTLDLWFGDALEMFESLAAHSPASVDAWFLDGFAPSKNPDMWSPELFSVMARLSSPYATLATFTAAGFVRRGLIAVGFEMQKAPGFGRKRDMLIGTFTKSETDNRPRNPALDLSSTPHVAIVGAGLAGANLALSLAQRGFAITLYDEGDIASGASGNPQGGFYPQLHAQISNASMVQALSFTQAKRRYLQLQRDGFDFAGEFCGVLLLGFSDAVKERQEKMRKNAPWPDELIAFVDKSEANRIAGINLHQGGVFIEDGGWISPPSLVQALINQASALTTVTVKTHHKVQTMEPILQGVQITANDKKSQYDHVCITTGASESGVDYLSSLPFGRTRGQVESVPASDASGSLQTVLCHKGYFTPQMEGRQALGSTYVRNDRETDYRQEEADTNLATHKKALPDAEFLDTIKHDYTGRAALRMTLPDHQPVIGIVHDEQFEGRLSVLCGLGSRGLTTAPLMAEILASELSNEPLPVAAHLYEAVHHTRFAKRAKKN